MEVEHCLPFLLNYVLQERKKELQEIPMVREFLDVFPAEFWGPQGTFAEGIEET